MKVKNYLSILNEKESLGERITYTDKLSSLEWIEKRKIILKRDNFLCTSCNRKPDEFIDGKYYRERTKEEKEKYINDYKEKKKESELGKASIKILGFIMPPGVPLVKVKEPTILHVHHSHYIYKKLPWEYPNDALITLCHDCHQNLHDNNKVPLILMNRN